MASAFKNFFLTFIICLLVFIPLVAFVLNPAVENFRSNEGKNPDNSESTENPGDESTETSENSAPVIDDENFDEQGDVFTAAIMCVDSNGRALNTVFIDSNAKTKQFIYCTIGSNIKSCNSQGTAVPVGDLFSMLTPEEVAANVSVMTGIETKYCLKFTRESLPAIAELIPGASVVLNEVITFVNPKYKEFVLEPGAEYPDDYYITISNDNGYVLLNSVVNEKTNLEWLLEYNPNADGSEYNAIYSQICKSLIRQFFEQESSTMNTAAWTALLLNCESNLTVDQANEHFNTIYSYDDFYRHEITYPTSWETAVSRLRDCDGSYNRLK